MPKLFSTVRNIVCTTLLCWPVTAVLADETECENWVARLESREGIVEVKHANVDTWQSVDIGACIPENSQLRVSGGRAVLRLPNESYLRASSDTLIEFSVPTERSWITLVRGWLHFLTRTPTEFDVETPYVNAGVKGTEFTISADENAQSSEITVLEGNILANDGTNEVSIDGGDRARFQTDQSPSVFHVGSTQESVQWTLYYSPLLVPDDPAFATTRNYLNNNSYLLALNALDNIDDSQQDSDYYSLRSSIYLYTGNVAEAEQQIAAALARDSNHPLALALRGVIAVTQHQLDAAEQDINRSLTQSNTDRERANALLARSYLQQARYQLPDSLASLDDAVSLQPDSALLLSRQAELALMLDNYTLAESASERAVKLQPQLGHAHSTRGFVLLQNLQFEAAQAAFSEAVRLDSSDPLPHLGLGLIAIRKNDVEYGRRKLELAAVLDPGRSLIRSYLGKAYSTEERDKLALTQFDLAEKMDPNDPTPWLYRAILEKNNDHPFQALEALNKSIELNGNRSIYRSRLNLDTDEASRMASQARIFTEFGLDESAEVLATDSVMVAPQNSAGHLLLAQTYADQTQLDESRSNEVFQAQINQPLSATPVLLFLNDPNFGVIQEVGPSQIGFNEYTGLFNQEDYVLQLSNANGSDNTRVTSWLLSGLTDSVSYAAGQYKYSSDGFKENGNVEYQVSSVFGQWQLSPSLDLQVESRTRDSVRGDIDQGLNENIANKTPLVDTNEILYRVNLAYKPTASNSFYANFHHIEADQKQSTRYTNTTSSMAPPLTIVNDITIKSDTDTQAKHVGIGYSQNSGVYRAFFGIYSGEYDMNLDIIAEGTSTVYPPPPNPPVVTPTNPMINFPNPNALTKYSSAYNYWNFLITDNLSLTAGASYDILDTQYDYKKVEKFNHKLGVDWKPNSALRFRLSNFSTLKLPTHSIPTLEPTLVGGLNQIFDETTSTESKVTAFAVDFSPVENVRAGLYAHDADKKSVASNSTIYTHFEHDHLKIYLDYVLYPISLSTSYTTDSHQRGVDTIQNNIITDYPVDLDTDRFTIQGKFFAEEWGTFSIKTVYDKQAATFELEDINNQRYFIKKNEDFVVVDLGYSKTLIKQHADLSIAIKNVFDKGFEYQGSTLLDPLTRTVEFIPYRTFLAKIDYYF